MKAVVVSPPRPGARFTERPMPGPSVRELLVRVSECGICGTDRDIVAGRYGSPPPGETDLILGHENLGEVERVGPDLVGWKPGDLVVSTVRRGCGTCRFCLTNQSDQCETGRFTERGIRGRDGFLAEFYVEDPEYVVRVPRRLRDVAVLVEPLSVVEKACWEGRYVLDRRGPTPGHAPDEPPRALVAGTGAVGMLAAFLLRSEGYSVTAIDRHGEDTPAAAVLRSIGATHADASSGIATLGGVRFEMIVEATGSATLDLELVRALGPNGVLVLTGIPSAYPAVIPVPAGTLLRDLVLENQAIVGSVNANRRYFERALDRLGEFRRRWGDAIDRVITERRPVDEFASMLSDPARTGMKSVLQFAPR